MYILDVICNKFYFGEVQEKVLGQCSGQGYISAPRTEGPSVYPRAVLEKNKQGGGGNIFLNTPLKLSLSWKSWKT